jgi:hypothetical protein
VDQRAASALVLIHRSRAATNSKRLIIPTTLPARTTGSCEISRNDVVDGGILVDAKGIRRHDRRDTKRAHALPDASTLLDAQKRFEPVAGRTDAKFIAMQEIAFCNDPHKAALTIKNGKAWLIGFEQQARGIDGAARSASQLQTRFA